MSALDRAASIDDLRELARRRLPRFAFDFIDGGAESERNLRRNSNAFADIELVPRYLVDVASTDTETTLFGQDYGVPFGMSPIGFLNMAWPGTDLAIAKLAARHRMPHVISTACSTPLEEVAETADGHAWFQLYVARDEAICKSLMDRARAAGIEVLVVTVDCPRPGKRDRDVRNSLAVPFRFTPRTLLDLALHPHWSLATLKAGPPGFANFVGDWAGNQTALSLIDIQKLMISDQLTWEGLGMLRDHWTGSLMLKGIQHPADASRAIDLGCDGIIVSNHGGRQADFAPPAIHSLAAIAATLGPGIPLVLDSGVRRGADIIRAKALGATLTITGRPFAYGAAAGAEDGCSKTFEILETELSRALGQLGVPHYADVDLDVLSAPSQLARLSDARSFQGPKTDKKLAIPRC